jgi:hypothetical protein
MRFLSRDETAVIERKYRREIDPMSRPKTIIYYDSGPRDHHPAASLIAWGLGDFDQAAVLFLSCPFGDGWDETQISNPRWQRYRQWRQGLGEPRRLYDVPGHIAAKDGATELAKVIEFALILGWDAIVGAEPGRNRLLLSHDDRLEIYRCAKWRGLQKRLVQLGYWQVKTQMSWAPKAR